MSLIRYTLVSEGSSDQALVPILTWTLRQHLGLCPIKPLWADLRRLPQPPSTLSDRVRKALELYPCDVLFIHRDADNQPRDVRWREIQEATFAAQVEERRSIPVIPVRMTEAWLLIDTQAIRKAAGNPNGTEVLDMPRPTTLEDIANPKERLRVILQTATGQSGRRLKRFNVDAAIRRISEFISDFSVLRKLPAFIQLEKDIRDWCARLEGS